MTEHEALIQVVAAARTLDQIARGRWHQAHPGRSFDQFMRAKEVAWKQLGEGIDALDSAMVEKQEWDHTEEQP